MYASEIMTKNVRTITYDKSAYEAAKIMKRHDIGALPVLKEGKLVGIVTESDIFKAVAAKDILASSVTVQKIMTKRVLTVPPDMKIHEVNGLLYTNNVRRLLIVQDGKLIGIISASDLIRQAYHWETK
jgi:CBS domain-containing protein